MLALPRTAPVVRPLARTLTACSSLAKNVQLPPRQPVNEADITEKFLKGSGPGGQKINKTSSAVQLVHRPTGTVVKCQATRSRAQNRSIARRVLAERLEVEEKGEESRVKVKEAVKSRKKASAAKKSRRKYRALEEEKKKRKGDGDEASAGEGSGGDAEGVVDAHAGNGKGNEASLEDGEAGQGKS